MKMTRNLFVSMMFMAVGVVAGACSPKPKNLTVYDVYTGEMRGMFNGESVTYHVRIKEMQSKYDFPQREVHLYVADSGSKKEIVGYDDSSKIWGNWSNISLCGYPDISFGCNSMSLVGMRMFEPNAADKDRLFSFSDAAINDARYELFTAMHRFHRPEFREDMLAGNPYPH
jgi:hypothetical protein